MSRVRLALLVLAAAVLVVISVAPAALATEEGVIVCSCRFCTQHPYVECQIGPGDGFSILCADYLHLSC